MRFRYIELVAVRWRDAESDLDSAAESRRIDIASPVIVERVDS
jgi:hypothetical protein